MVRNLAAQGAFEPTVRSVVYVRVLASLAKGSSEVLIVCLRVFDCAFFLACGRQKRTDAVAFCVGDVVDVKATGRGVVTGWTLARSHAFADLRVTYDILLHCRSHSWCEH